MANSENDNNSDRYTDTDYEVDSFYESDENDYEVNTFPSIDMIATSTRALTPHNYEIDFANHDINRTNKNLSIEQIQYGGHLLSHMNFLRENSIDSAINSRYLPLCLHRENNVDERFSKSFDEFEKMRYIPQLDILSLVLEMLQGSENDLFHLVLDQDSAENVYDIDTVTVNFIDNDTAILLILFNSGHDLDYLCWVCASAWKKAN